MSTDLIILLLQEIAKNAPALVADFKEGKISVETQQEIFDAMANLTDMFHEKQWQKRE